MLFAMFIRRTGTRTGAGGEVYYSHRLVRSERTGEKVRQRILLNLGSNCPGCRPLLGPRLGFVQAYRMSWMKLSGEPIRVLRTSRPCF